MFDALDEKVTVRGLIDAKTAELASEGYGSVQSAWDDSNPDNQIFVLSAEEALVLDIRPKQWPRMRAAILAFEAYSDFCDGGEYPVECWKEVKRDRPDIPAIMENIEAFAEFCVAYAGLSGEQAYRAWYKWELWHIRMGYSYCPTCTNPISDTYRARKAIAEATTRGRARKFLRTAWEWSRRAAWLSR
jgi:hypothetical protein